MSRMKRRRNKKEKHEKVETQIFLLLVSNSWKNVCESEMQWNGTLRIEAIAFLVV